MSLRFSTHKIDVGNGIHEEEFKLCERLASLIVTAVVLVALMSCSGAKLDLTNIEQPVLLNENAFSESSKKPEGMRKLPNYRGIVSESSGFSSQFSGSGDINNAESEAFEVLAGRPGGVITDVKFDLEALGWLLIFGGGDWAKIKATGTSCEYYFWDEETQ